MTMMNQQGNAAQRSARSASTNGDVDQTLASLRAVVLLGGSVRPTVLGKAIGRSMLDLPVDHARSLLQMWQHQVRDLAGTLALGSLPIRVMMDRASLPPSRFDDDDAQTPLQVEQDQLGFRGTGGVLRDGCEHYQDDDLILVATAAQLLTEPLLALARAMAAQRAAVSLVSHADGSPAGLMLVRCQALRGISPIGFVDMKEQCLPTIARDELVSVLWRRQAAMLPVRTIGDYITALHRAHCPAARDVMADTPFAERWRPTFNVVEEGAVVAADASVHDAVVLAGGRVEAGAVVVRSVVCPDGVVARGQTVLDEVVSASKE